MAQVVQAACPGCKKALRLPADWLQQPMKCKHCGMTFVAKGGKEAANASARSSSPLTAQTPLPPTKPMSGTPVTTPASPFAELNAPATQSASATGSPFADIDVSPSPAYRRRRRSRGSWAGPLLALFVLGAAGVGAAVYWPKIAGLLGRPSNKQVANADKEDDDAADNVTSRKTDIPTRPVSTAPSKADDGAKS